MNDPLPTPPPSTRPRAALALLLAANAALALCSAAAARAQIVPTLRFGPRVGSSQPAPAAPLVARPTSRPYVVPLFTSTLFENYDSHPFAYAPPPARGPWAKVVLVVEFAETAGRQFDRTATISIGDANIYFGTTPEPRSALAPVWRAERDVTDYSALLAKAQSGEADLGNLVGVSGGVDYTGIISGSAFLEFYPPTATEKAPAVPDVVTPLNTGGGPAGLGSPTDTLSNTITFPADVTRAYLDLVTQSQGSDEFWYTNVPDQFTTELDEEGFGGTAFREAEITIDGQPAGAAPVYPWIYTGGIDPYLWEPIPGVQTLNFVPYRVDLTPFAGLFSNGQPHTVAVSVANDQNSFSVTGSLLLYLDPKGTPVQGGVTLNEVGSAPSPLVASDLITDAAGDVSGPVDVTASRQFSVEGYTIGSQGRVTTRTDQVMSFVNGQYFSIPADGSSYSQTVAQLTRTLAVTTTTVPGSPVREVQKEYDYPLTVMYDYEPLADGFTQTASVRQGDFVTESDTTGTLSTFSSMLSDEVTTTDDLTEAAAVTAVGQSQEVYAYSDSTGSSYNATVTQANRVVTGVSVVNKLKP